MRPRSTTPQNAELATDLTELLAQALERAVVVARQDAGSREAPPPPAALRPVLRFTRLPARALQTVYEVLDTDDDFRSRVAATVEERDVDRAAWLFLDRPEGWKSELSLLSAAADEELADELASREEQSATRRAAQLEETVERLRGERDDAVRSAEVAEQAAAGERRSARALEAERDALLRERDDLESARGRAVRELKTAEALSASRLEELRQARRDLEALETRLAELAERPEEPEADLSAASVDVAGSLGAPGAASTATRPDPWQLVDPVAVAAAVTAASQAATSLSAALGSAAQLLSGLGATSSPLETAAPSERTEPQQTPRDAGGPRPPRRTPVRLRQGVHEGSAEGVEQLLGLAGLVAIIDGYNVSMELWPSLGRTEQRNSLIRSLGSLAARLPATIHVVFDGDDDGRRPTVGAPLPVRVHFSHAEVEADDLILDMVAELPTDVPVMVVSTDRRVADGARRLGANAVRSGELIALLAR